MITKKQLINFREYRENSNADIQIWEWLFTNKLYKDAAAWLSLTIQLLEAHKQTDLLARYCHNLGVTYLHLKDHRKARAAFEKAYKYDRKRHGILVARRMLAYKTLKQLKRV